MKENAKYRWLVLVYLFLMFTTTYVINSGNLLADKGITSNVFVAAYIVAAIAVIALGFVKLGFGHHYAWIYTVLFAAFLMLAAFNLGEPKDRLHFLEYGLLFVLLYRAMRGIGDGVIRYGLTLILTSAIGLVDETVQSVYSFFDLSDVMNNAFAGYLAAGVTLVWERC